MPPSVVVAKPLSEDTMTTWARRSFPIALSTAIAVGGCADPERLQVYGRDIGSSWANVSVLDASGTPLGDARVTVNRVQLSARSEPGLYSGEYAPEGQPGHGVHVVVSRGDSTVTGHGNVPLRPSLAWPQPEAWVPATGDIDVEWGADAEPDRFVVAVRWSCGDDCGTGMNFDVPAGQHTLEIPGAALPYAQIAGQDLWLAVYAYNDGVLQGDYETHAGYPGLHLRADSYDAILHTTLVEPR